MKIFNLFSLKQEYLKKTTPWKTLTPKKLSTWLACAALLPIAAIALLVHGQAAPPNIPAVALANEPLYAAATIDKPAMVLALSVEYPTVGAQYVSRGSNDAVNTYSNTDEYLGYYDAESCYSYNNNPSETVASGKTLADYKRFDRTGPATSRKCENSFSGNFLNWSSSSAIDMLRLALSGGDRYIDSPALTILQRAVIPNGDPVCMWNTGNFPAKQLLPNNGDYFGAVPTAMRTAAGTNSIFVGNTLNRIYFKAGNSSSGTCNKIFDYTLGGPNLSSIQKGPQVSFNGNLPSNMLELGVENDTYYFTGTKEVWYGTDTRWTVLPANGGIDCYYSGAGSPKGGISDPASGTLKRCYVRSYSGSWQATSSSAQNTLNSDGYFYSRVQVCNSTNGVLQDNRDYNLCRQYPNGNYKPTGVIQKYSDQLRLAAFGYLMDQTASYNNGRYGGVLRAPMKYVGTKTYNENGQDNTPTGGNPKAEWNANTGVFIDNPENDSMQISGVINYLNKFGRTGPTPGRYKYYDPVGEMYYQNLRYLQGLPPTNDAISGLTDVLKDGFPVYTTWEDPYGETRSDTSDYSCLKSNIVVIGDVNTHDGNWRNIPTTDNKSANVPNFRTWHSLVQSFEKGISTNYLDGQGVTRSSSNPNAVNNNVPSSTQTSQIMGYAYWAHTHDIRGADWTVDVGTKKRPGLRVKTYLFDVNENGSSNDDTYRKTKNQFFMASKYGGFESDPSNQGRRPYNTWGNPFKQQDATNNNNVWQKLTDPGEASTYYLQSKARGVLSAFDEIFSRAATAANSIAGVSTSSSVISSTTGAVLYSAKFDTSNWSGDVQAIPVSTDTSNALTTSAPLWSASAQLNVMTSPASNRNIVVGSTGSASNPAATSFTWDAISTQLKSDLGKLNPTATGDTRGQQRLNYIRGDRSLEGNPFRVRSSLLGDIVNSNVVYSGAATGAFTGTAYTAFNDQYKNRTPSVFVGANDGMLHSFNANNGNELFAYIPSWLGSKLAALTDTSFINNHKNYVDGPLTIGEAQVANNGTASDWKTVLTGGTGGGGSGIFALDVSNPASFSASNVMWEFTRSDDADLGQIIGKPQILKFKTSGDAATSTYRWFVVVVSGVNNYVPESANGPFSSTGNPAIFLLALDKAPGSAWALGTNYFKVSLPADSNLKPTTATGVANFSALYGSQGEVTDIYAGDFYGNLWKLRFQNKATTAWDLNNLSDIRRGSGTSTSAAPLYIARDGSTTPKAQAITAAPTLFTGPLVSGVETFYVSFGTGKYIEPSDNISTTTNSFYVIFDNNSTVIDTSTATDGAIAGRSRLVQATVDTSKKTITVPAFKWGRASSATDTSKRSGWYFDFPASGEKLIGNIVDLELLNGSFNTVIPGSSGATAGSCAANQGSSNAYIFNASTGTAQYVQSTVGIQGPPVFFANSAETQVSQSDSTGRRTRITTKRGLSVGQSGITSSGQSIQISEAIGRLSWRQIQSYQDMKNAP